MADEAANHLDRAFEKVPLGLPTESIYEDAKGSTWCVLYGFDQWYKLFTPRQHVALATFVRYTRAAREEMRFEAYPSEWAEATAAYLALSFDRLASFCCANVRWKLDAEAVVDAFPRFAIPILWDFAEAIPI